MGNTAYEKNKNIGEVRIADDVVAVISGIAAMEVDGIASMAGNITKDIIFKLGGKSLAKGVKVEMKEDSVVVYLAINIKYGYNVPATSKKIQEKVKSSVENMTGLTVSSVNVSIAGVVVEN